MAARIEGVLRWLLAAFAAAPLTSTETVPEIAVNRYWSEPLFPPIPASPRSRRDAPKQAGRKPCRHYVLENRPFSPYKNR